MNVLELLPGMPLFWFVHSLHSPILEYKWTEKKSGKIRMQVGAFGWVVGNCFLGTRVFTSIRRCRSGKITVLRY